MKKRLMAWLLALVLCMGLMAGCGQDIEENTPDTDDTDPAATGVVIDPDAAYAKYSPEDVVMTINGSDVTWSEFFYNLYTQVYLIQYYSGGNVVWSDSSVLDAAMTNEEYAWENALNTCIQYHVMDQNIPELGVTLTAEDEVTIQETLAEDMLNFCGEDATEEEFNAFLEDIYLSRETYDFMNRVAQLYDRSYDTVFGQNGEHMSDEEIQQFADSSQYITVKHILIKTQYEDGTDMEDTALAEKTALATLILSQLQEVENDRDALLSKFDELMNEYTEDTGLAYYPDGYTFCPGEMVEEFDTAARALKEYEITDLVKSDYGYHIILRLPTTRDSVVTYVDANTSYTLGAYAAAEAYGKLLDSWVSEAQVNWTSAFENLTAENIFA